MAMVGLGSAHPLERLGAEDATHQGDVRASRAALRRRDLRRGGHGLLA